jgi:hypothetical protein
MMYLSTNKLLCSIQTKFGKTIIRTIFNPFASKPIEPAKDAHSNLLTDTENVFELQHHTVKSNSMVNKYAYFPMTRIEYLQSFFFFIT